MYFDIKKLIRPDLQIFTPYMPGKTIEAVAKEQSLTDIIKLASNENAWGCSANVHAALTQLSNQSISLYPNSISHAFRHKLANFLGIETDMLILNNGSDSLLGLLLICFALHQDKVVLTHEYAFSVFEIQAKTLGVKVIITQTHDWQVDIDAMIKACQAKTALIYIANPNNPTGLLIPHADIKRLLKSIPTTTILVLDEAYYEYARAQYHENSLELLEQYPNLVITRTFSKAYGLAGLRLGYAMAHPEIINLLYRVQLPFAVNIAAITAADVAIDDQLFIQNTVKLTAQGVQQMQTGLAKINLNYLPTTANFITIDCQQDGDILFERLQTHGIIVRPLKAYHMNHYLRVTIGTAIQNERFLKSLGEILNHE